MKKCIFRNNFRYKHVFSLFERRLYYIQHTANTVTVELIFNNFSQDVQFEDFLNKHYREIVIEMNKFHKKRILQISMFFNITENAYSCISTLAK